MPAEAVRKPKVSLVVPAYSRPQFLRECLASIMAQTEPDWECIVVDDASPEGPHIQRVVAELGDSRFRYIRRSRNGGPAAARNTGIRAAKADLFLCVDEDDRLLPEALEILLEKIRVTGADVVCPQARLFGGAEGIREAKEPTLDLMLTGMWLLPNGWIMKKHLWEKVGGYDEDPRLIGRDDWEIWLRVLVLGASVIVVRDALYEWRIPPGGVGQPGSLEHEARSREVACIRYVTRKHRQVYERHPNAKKIVRLRSLRIEREWYKKEGNSFKAALRAIQVLAYERTKNELQRVARQTIVALLGTTLIEKVRPLMRTVVKKVTAQ